MLLSLVDARMSVADRTWLTNVYPFYLHDLSEYDEGYYHLNEQGLWEPDHLPSWLDGEEDWPLVIMDDRQRIGFALVNQAPSPYITPGMDYRMSEFFILRRCRRNGKGKQAASLVFDRFPGLWEVSELPRNTNAIAFWRRIIGEYTGGQYEESFGNGVVRQSFRAERRTLVDGVSTAHRGLKEKATFRLATMADVDLLLPLIENYYEFDHIPFDREQMQLPLEQLLRDPALGQGWLVVVDDKIIGYALLTFGFDLEFGGRQATLTDLYLQQDYRHQGIGRQTLQFIEETCQTLGITALELQVERKNIPARRLYTQFGMTTHDRIPLSKRFVR